MNGWMDRLIDISIDGWMDRWIDIYIYVYIYIYIGVYIYINIHIYRCVYIYTSIYIGVYIYIYIYMCVCMYMLLISTHSSGLTVIVQSRCLCLYNICTYVLRGRARVETERHLKEAPESRWKVTCRRRRELPGTTLLCWRRRSEGRG